jgi:hypothetical protein
MEKVERVDRDPSKVQNLPFFKDCTAANNGRLATENSALRTWKNSQ